jgi:hypothetical protein
VASIYFKDIYLLACRFKQMFFLADVTVNMFHDFQKWQEAENLKRKAENEMILQNQERILQLLSAKKSKEDVVNGFKMPMALPANTVAELEAFNTCLSTDNMFHDFMVSCHYYSILHGKIN